MGKDRLGVVNRELHRAEVEHVHSDAALGEWMAVSLREHTSGPVALLWDWWCEEVRQIVQRRRKAPLVTRRRLRNLQLGMPPRWLLIAIAESP